VAGMDRTRDKMCLNKRRFATEAEALKDAEERLRTGYCFVPLRAYFCPFSQDTDPHFHLTKKFIPQSA
jgi:hypothetical protein